MGFIGRMVGGAVSTAVGVTAANYMVRGIDGAVTNHQENRRLSDAEIGQMLVQNYMTDDNLLPVDAQARAAVTLQVATQRSQAAGYYRTGPLGDRMLNGNVEYCRALMALENVRVTDIKDWWDTHDLLREVFVIRQEETFAKTRDGLVASGCDQDTAAHHAWRQVALFGPPDLSPDRDPDYAPLPPELFYRVAEYFGQYPMPYAGEAPDAAGDGRPTVNGFVRQQVAAGAI